MICPFCKDNIKPFDNVVKNHLVVGKLAKDGHIHIHGDLTKKEEVKELLTVTAEEAGISLEKGILEKKEIVFHNRQRIGDILMFTCAIRDFKAVYPNIRVNVISTAGHIWDYNPNIDRSLVPTEENTIKIGPGKLTNASNRLDWHFANAYRMSIEDALKIHIPQGESRPDIWFTEEEYNAPRITEKPYWIIVVGGEKGWGCKMYPLEKWQMFVEQNPDTLFYQIGAQEDNYPKLTGPNVVDYVGKTQDRETGIRNLFKLFLNAEGSIGLVSFQMHLSGALKKPCIVVAGAREPVHFTRYPGQQYLNTEGCLPCSAGSACWHCDISACTDLKPGKVPACVDMISPEDLTRALNQYYIGGRLKKGVCSPKPKLKNVVPTPEKVIVPVKPAVENPYPLPFNGGSITEKDWEFMLKAIKDSNSRIILEFGAGLSTLLLNDLNLKVTTFETNLEWIKKIKDIKPSCDIRLWDGKSLDLIENYDFAFVDGPAGGASREEATRLAAARANTIIIHDANREFERKWQDKYIKNAFIGPTKGGNRCHLWRKQTNAAQASMPQNEPELPQISIPRAKESKSIKVVSTARGWGGCARSITTIMKLLLQAGHKVEFIPFRNAVGSKEFRACIANEMQGLKVTETYETVSEACDIFFMYADDYIWEFNKPEISDVFSGINARKKIMMLNYRRGPVGQAPWTRGWDKYMFLNSTQEKELLKVHPGVKTRVLPPCTDLRKFFNVSPVYNNKLRIVRHSSQGDSKYPPDFQAQVFTALESRQDIEIHLMPAPSFCADHINLIKHTKNDPPVHKFLELGNLFWYSLPQGYMDMGPRVILEAMAAGLPVLADNWGGAVDRVIPECGWLCNSKEEQLDIIRNVTFEELEKKGKAAKARALAEFIPENYIKEITGE